jgi:hypothetical protein
MTRTVGIPIRVDIERCSTNRSGNTLKILAACESGEGRLSTHDRKYNVV